MSHETLHEEAVGRYTVKVVHDDTPFDPREDFAESMLGEMLYVSRDYKLGDRRADPEEIDAIRKRKDVVYLLVYAYIHSGVRLSARPFTGLPQGHAEFDSGCCGIIYTTRERVKKLTGKRMTRKRIEAALKEEVEEYDAYVAGACYGFEVEDETGETVESCYGFLGWDGDDRAAAEGREVAERLAKADRAKMGPRHVVVSGTPADGFTFTGPYEEPEPPPAETDWWRLPLRAVEPADGFDPSGTFAVALGSLEGGWRLHGPFATLTAAQRWAACEDHFEVVTLTPPTNNEEDDDGESNE